ncbi:hypothetical protein [Parachitinimonas caeni]|uniref:Photosynthesis system II assembly factor Ycf48/Hcf136-like domain-containing protein n=1 Tax=Parachitinimonas caeni TaxID=3031301 RepID=A0ABT7E2Y2_9NEIS|nr:hypothetical protein [Parachitinimonas caeni]MDK2126676.1 hypothetical protein [Parachitinimonas caeni]
MVQMKGLRGVMGALVGVMGLFLAVPVLAEVDQWTRGEGQEGIDVADLVADKSGNVYALTKEGIFRKKKESLEWGKLNIPAKPNGFGFFQMKAINGYFYVAGDAPDYFVSNDGGDTWEKLNHGEKFDFVPDGQGGVFYLFSHNCKEKELLWVFSTNKQRKCISSEKNMNGFIERSRFDSSYVDAKFNFWFAVGGYSSVGHSLFVKRQGADVYERVSGLPTSYSALSITGDVDGNLYVIGENQIWKSTDGGKIWKPVASLGYYMHIRQNVWKDYEGNFFVIGDHYLDYIGMAAIAKFDSNWVLDANARGQASSKWMYSFAVDANSNFYAGTGAGIAMSGNRGKSWQILNKGLPNYSAYALKVTQSGIVYADTDSGIIKSENYGQSWEVTDLVPSTLANSNKRLYASRFVNQRHLSGGGCPRNFAYFMWDNKIFEKYVCGLMKGYIGNEAGDVLKNIYNGGVANKYDKKPSVKILYQLQNGELLAGVQVENGGPAYFSVYEAFSHDSSHWPIRSSLAEEIDSLIEGANGHLFLRSTKGFHISRDFGRTWGALKNHPSNIVSSPRGNLFGWYGGSNKIYTSRDSGTTWLEVAEAPAGKLTGLVEAMDGSLFARYASNEIYRSSDGGLRWVLSHDGLAGSGNINDMAADAKGNVYVATDNGVYQITSRNPQAAKSFTVKTEVENPVSTPKVTANLAINAADVGKPGYLYVGAVVGGNAYLKGPSGWAPLNAASPLAYSAVTLGTHSIPVLDGTLNIAPYKGAQLFVGYGLSADDMMLNQRYQPIYTVQ